MGGLVRMFGGKAAKEGITSTSAVKGDRKSISGWVAKLNGDPVSWSSKSDASCDSLSSSTKNSWNSSISTWRKRRR